MIRTCVAKSIGVQIQRLLYSSTIRLQKQFVSTAYISGCTHGVTSQTSYSPEYITPTHTHKIVILEYIDIEGTRLSSEMSPNWTDLTS
jgi:hypothetical protein